MLASSGAVVARTKQSSTTTLDAAVVDAMMLMAVVVDQCAWTEGGPLGGCPRLGRPFTVGFGSSQWQLREWV